MLSYFHIKSISGTRLDLLWMSDFFYEIMTWQRTVAKNRGADQYHGIRDTEEISTRAHMQFIYVTVIKSFNKFRL